VSLVGRDVPAVLRGLLRKALEDGVAAVREAAISALPRLWSMFADQQAELAELRENIQMLSQSELYRQRMTFVACLQALIVDAPDNKPFITSEADLWSAATHLADDAVVGVRIGIARLARVASERSQSRQQSLLDLIRHLSLDSSHDVRSYVADSLNTAPAPVHSSGATFAEVTTIRPPRHPKFATFSRPPPHSSPSMFSGTSLHADIVNDEIRRGLTRSATNETGAINSNSPLGSISTLGTASAPEEGNFARPARTNPGSAELLSESKTKRTIPVPG